jgi:hypothetical protein
MQCNGSKQTPLTLALLRGEAGEDMVHELLCSGAAESVCRCKAQTTVPQLCT